MPEFTQDEADRLAARLVRALCGEAWSPVSRVVDRYPVSTTGVVLLRGRPVVEVFSATLSDASMPTGGWTLDNGYILNVGSSPTRRAGATVAVDYSYGVTQPPSVARRAIAVLSKEILLADSNNPMSRIPERVTNVTRQGISWTLLDPQTFLSEGRTGIYEVDLAIRALNPGKAKSRARVFSAAFPPPTRRRVP